MKIVKGEMKKYTKELIEYDLNIGRLVNLRKNIGQPWAYSYKKFLIIFR